MSANQKRAVLRKAREQGREIQHEGFLEDLALVNIDNPYFHDCTLNFARKLALALHYKHTSHVVPERGRVAVAWFTNVNNWLGEMPEVNILHGSIEIHFNRAPLRDQFDYRYGVAEGGMASAYKVVLRDAIALLCFVFEAPNAEDNEFFAKPRHAGQAIFPPFAWT